MKEHFKYRFSDLFNPTLTALHVLGGSGSVDEIEDQVATILKLTDEQVNEIHRGNTTKLTYRLAWARNYLKHYGLLENSSRGVWALTEQGLKTKSIDKDVVNKKVAAESKKGRLSKETPKEVEPIDEAENEEIERLSWQEQIIEELQNISPSSFERLCQRLLRELGFQNVEVTGRVNDGGIDGKGLLRLGGVLSFHVIFQAKRYKGSVSPSIIRDFRGAMVGRADKGLIITTGTFTREAKKEAQRDGAPPIDLMDGSDLAEKLKELRLGVDIELIEKVNIKKEWFKTL
ncbi:restriction endonuclease [Dyadobacter chenhuakuii]|uniref:Restriction endonuclease n=1 Tax=Dyadobacter chenhuakuii TaxID=2909339 RepID=A0ABY4XHS7_9BACT|nr:restriction endonuclease [Dyadobacter chenhuakuii]MCF2495770.1 restriction endonuclease [Dyadobacter chenhuakuii]USJ29801.1 restriction endonuclease [Dyadobacter chenhuakuii]